MNFEATSMSKSTYPKASTNLNSFGIHALAFSAFTRWS